MTATGSKFLFLLLGVLIALPAPAAECVRDKFIFSEAKRFYLSNQYLMSALHFSELRAEPCDRALSSYAWVGYSLAMSNLNEPVEAVSSIETALQSPTVTVNDKMALRMAKSWITQQPDSNLTSDQLARWNTWSTRADKKMFTAELAHVAQKDLDKTSLADLQVKFSEAPKKSLWVAGLASTLVPGAGQAYVGNWQAAGLSLVLNAILLGSTLEFAHHDLPAAAVASGAIFSVTYIGNILSAVEGAKASNKLSQAPIEAELKSSLLPELNVR